MDKSQQNIYIAQKIFCKINNLHDTINVKRFKRLLIEIVSYTYNNKIYAHLILKKVLNLNPLSSIVNTANRI